MEKNSRKVLVLLDLTEEQRKRLERPSLVFSYLGQRTPDLADIEEADIIFGNPPPAMLASARRLELLQLETAGADRYVQAGILPAGARLANASGAYGLAISEHMLAMLLCLLKKMGPYLDNMKNSQWKDLGRVKSVWGSRTLVVGMGDIGSEFARKMAALGSSVCGIKKHAGPRPPYIESLRTMDCLDEELARADIVACSLPETAETKGLFDAARISRMKRGAILINVGRGSLISADALCAALSGGRLGGACLDVAEEEPCPASSPLWKAPNLILTPHVSGGHHLPETVNRIVEIAARNMERICKGGDILNEVDCASGYRRPENRGSIE